ncbi:MAG: hypothetical protein PHW75_03415 [Patescibacteria group bacterium]|nr:hypothetical protein [Patescibacteria group bacterium]
MSGIIRHAIDPWLRLRLTFTRLESLMTMALGEGPILLNESSLETVRRAKKFFDQLYLYVEGLKRSIEESEGDDVDLGRIPHGIEFDEVEAFMADYVPTVELPNFYEPTVSGAILVALGEVHITGILSRKFAMNWHETISDISRFAVNKTSGDFDRVEIVDIRDPE